MSPNATGPRTLPAEVLAGVVERLRPRHSEIAEAVLARMRSTVPDRATASGAGYEDGQRAACAACVDYALQGIAEGAEATVPVPSEAIDQAQRAARSGVGLDVVLLRYTAGNRVFGDFVMEEARHLPPESLRHVMGAQWSLFEDLVATVSAEYNAELERISRSPELRRAEIVQRLLSGEPVDSGKLADLDYEIYTYWHIGLIATGAEAESFLQKLSRHYPGRLLTVSLGGSLSAWAGTQTPPRSTDFDRLATQGGTGVSLAVGEAAKGLDGWRLTHGQAKAAMGLALYKPGSLARYADDRLLAATLQNDTLEKSLTERFLVPLRRQPDGGEKLRHTLQTYIDLECNASSAAHGLGVRRQTLVDRVHKAEELIGCPVYRCLPELGVALRLEALDRNTPTAALPRPRD